LVDAQRLAHQRVDGLIDLRGKASDASYGSAMVNINSKAEALKRVREAQNKANEARFERERQNVDEAASFLVELGRLSAVDEWEHNRILEVHAEGERRRHEHRLAGAAAWAFMQGRGETLAAIAELAGVTALYGARRR